MLRAFPLGFPEERWWAGGHGSVSVGLFSDSLGLSAAWRAWPESREESGGLYPGGPCPAQVQEGTHLPLPCLLSWCWTRLPRHPRESTGAAAGHWRGSGPPRSSGFLALPSREPSCFHWTAPFSFVFCLWPLSPLVSISFRNAVNVPSAVGFGLQKGAVSLQQVRDAPVHSREQR